MFPENPVVNLLSYDSGKVQLSQLGACLCRPQGIPYPGLVLNQTPAGVIDGPAWHLQFTLLNG
jgi:hypothetical protein